MSTDAQLVISTVAWVELLVRPYADGRPGRAHAVRRALETLPGLTILKLPPAVAGDAAGIRASTGLPLPDALVRLSAAAC